MATKITPKMRPQMEELEAVMRAKIVTYKDIMGPCKGSEFVGGQCSCCGGGPTWAPDWRRDPWLIYRAGICDSDGVFYSMLCEGCLDEIRAANFKRKPTERDTAAAVVSDLLGDDIDGAQAMMEDLEI